MLPGRCRTPRCKSSFYGATGHSVPAPRTVKATISTSPLSRSITRVSAGAYARTLTASAPVSDASISSIDTPFVSIATSQNAVAASAYQNAR